LQPGPIFTLFEDNDGAARRVLDDTVVTAPFREAEGPEGARDRVWKITKPDSISALEVALAGERFFIADGHHRYETALAYREEISGGQALPEDHPANFVLAAAVPMGDPGLFILPTHRLLSLDNSTDVSAAVRTLEADYVIERGKEGGEAAVSIYAAGERYRLALRESARRELESELGPLMAGLNVNEVRHRILPRFFEDVDRAVAEERITYTHDTDEALGLVDSGSRDAAVLLTPLPVRTVAAVSAAGETLPPKSTYFFPKIPTGIVLNPLA
jgi:uncharacterized protein (DUF1015 family)